MAPVRNHYFYNILFLIVCSVILYLISNQVLFMSDQTTFTSASYRHRPNNGHNLHYDYRDIRRKGDVREVRVKTSVSSSSNSVSSTISGGKDAQIMENSANELQTENTRPDWLRIFSETAQKVYQMVSQDHLSDFRIWAIDKQRELLKEELQGFKSLEKERKLDDLILEKGGQPIRNVVFTTWRSGSTFLGGVLESHPGTYYHYEPLLHFDIVQVRSEKLGQEGVRVIKDLLNCRYNNLTDYIEYSKTHHWVYNHNSRVWQYCEKRYEVCWDPYFLSNMCKMFPYQSMKTVRMRLKFAKLLLDDTKLNLRILLLIRDPRGTLQSRQHPSWCRGVPDCQDPNLLCSDLVEDYHEAKRLMKDYPGRFMTLRYEDISTNPNSAVNKLFKFFRLQYFDQVKYYVKLHTSVDILHEFSTFRNSKMTPFHWKTDFSNNFTAIEQIQTSCAKAMKLWGYVPASDKEHLASLNPVSKPPWKDMIIPEDIS